MKTKSKAAIALSVLAAIALGAGGAAYAYTGPQRAYDKAYSEYEQAYAAHADLVATAGQVHGDCTANQDLVPDMEICTDLFNAYENLDEIDKLAELKNASRSEYKTGLAQVQAALKALVSADDNLRAAADGASEDLATQAGLYQEDADKQVAEYEQAASQDREDAAGMKGALADDGPRLALVNKIDALDEAINAYRDLDDNASALERKEALAAIKQAADVENQSYISVLATLPVEATPASITASGSGGQTQAGATSSVLTARIQARAQAARPNTGTPSQASTTSSSSSATYSGYSGGSSTASSGSSSYTPPASSGGSSTPAPSTPPPATPPASSGGTSGTEWHDGSVFTEVEPDLITDDGAVCTEMGPDGLVRQVPCDW